MSQGPLRNPGPAEGGPDLTPSRDCARCPRLVGFREESRARHPDWHNAPVASFGGCDARLLIVGLAPGLAGANRTGRPFTGDFAGRLLYSTLAKFGFAEGAYGERADDGIELIGARITNALRCVPPRNRPEAAEINACRAFLAAEIAAMERLKVVLALGTVAHGAALAALGERRARFPFAHGALYELACGIALGDSYHCSRYNTNTGRLTGDMFDSVFARIRRRLDGRSENYPGSA